MLTRRHHAQRASCGFDVDADGNFYYASLYARAGISSLNISVHKGRFEGDQMLWQSPTFATTFTTGFGADKEHIGVDKVTGDIYVSYSNFTASPRRIEVVRSTDGGQTWSAPVVLASGDVQGSVPRVGPDGEIYVAWATWPGSPRTDSPAQKYEQPVVSSREDYSAPQRPSADHESPLGRTAPTESPPLETIFALEGYPATDRRKSEPARIVEITPTTITPYM